MLWERWEFYLLSEGKEMFESDKQDKIYREIYPFNASKEALDWAQKNKIELQYLMTYYKCALREIETKFRVLDEEFSLKNGRRPINSIKTRLKSIPSIIEKLERKEIKISLSAVVQELNDIAGIRVICLFTEDVYKLADALLRQENIVLIEKKDYIKNPKKDGYRSLHLIVEVPIFLENEKRIIKVEIQLRTIAMDCWASMERQLRYKKDVQLTEIMQDEIFQCAQLSMELDEKMDWLREMTNV